jgi:hypothetical protein
VSWLVVGVNSISWPTKETKIIYKGQELILRPSTEKFAQSVVAFSKGLLNDEDRFILIRRFLSALAWHTGHPVEETTSVRGSVPMQIGRGPLSCGGSTGFELDHIPETDNPKALLALAFYREALNVNSTPYKFLGFFKIINILHENGKSQIQWIKNTLPKLDNLSARERVAKLEGTQGEKVADYLYYSGRCAVAHAFAEPLIDPERPEDSIRLQNDLVVIQALSEYLIENELEIKSRKTVWSEHLYELDGFRFWFGKEQLSGIKRKEGGAIELVAPLPVLSVRLRDVDIFSWFESLVPEIIANNNGRILLRCTSTKNNNIVIRLGLNFADERIEFDPENIMEIQDDGFVEVIEAAIQKLLVLKGLVLNGQLEIWDFDQTRLLGRTDPYIPVNIDLERSLKSIEEKIMELKEIKETRTAEDLPMQTK